MVFPPWVPHSLQATEDAVDGVEFPDCSSGLDYYAPDWLAHIPEELNAKFSQTSISAFNHIPSRELARSQSFARTYLLKRCSIVCSHHLSAAPHPRRMALLLVCTLGYLTGIGRERAACMNARTWGTPIASILEQAPLLFFSRGCRLSQCARILRRAPFVILMYPTRFSQDTLWRIPETGL